MDDIKKQKQAQRIHFSSPEHARSLYQSQDEKPGKRDALSGIHEAA